LDADEIIAQLLPMFFEDMREKLETLDVLRRNLSRQSQRGEEFFEFMRLVHSIKGTAPSFGLSTVGLIAHKLEEYMLATNGFSRKAEVDTARYLDRMAEIIESGREPSERTCQDIIKGLPAPVDFGQVMPTRGVIQALFIAPKNIQSRMVEAELRNCGCNVTIAQSSFQGLELAVRLRPDLIMVSNIIDTLGGVEVVQMLKVMGPTRNIPTMFVKSEIKDPVQRAALRAAIPPGVPVVRKGRCFPEDFASALLELRVI
jgi:HPt (histidine-containing phosphotransfer) domain-containing protein